MSNINDRDMCIKLLKGLIEDMKSNVKNEEIHSSIYQTITSIHVGLDFSERGNGEYADYLEYAWYK